MVHIAPPWTPHADITFLRTPRAAAHLHTELHKHPELHERPEHAFGSSWDTRITHTCDSHHDHLQLAYTEAKNTTSSCVRISINQ